MTDSLIPLPLDDDAFRVADEARKNYVEYTAIGDYRLETEKRVLIGTYLAIVRQNQVEPLFTNVVTSDEGTSYLAEQNGAMPVAGMMKERANLQERLISQARMFKVELAPQVAFSLAGIALQHPGIGQSDRSSEMLDNDKLLELIFTWSREQGYEVVYPAAEELIESLKPYLRTTEPVMVSLESLARRIVHDVDDLVINGYQRQEYPELAAERLAKAVLDAAGVNYVD